MAANAAMTRHAPGIRAAVFAVILLVGGCGIFNRNKINFPCPPVAVPDEVGKLTKFRQGPGRDIIDMSFEAEITGYKGTCSYGRKGVSVDLTVIIEASRGPANRERRADFKYFVAVPKLFPLKAAKNTFDVQIAFPGNRTRGRLTDEVELKIPLKRDESGGRYEVFVGFQLNASELEYNRSRSR